MPDPSDPSAPDWEPPEGNDVVVPGPESLPDEGPPADGPAE